MNDGNETQGQGGEKPPAPAGAGEKPAQGAPGEKPAGQTGEGKYTQKQVDDIVNESRRVERQKVLDEQKAEQDKAKLTADQRAAAAETATKAANDLATLTRNENAVLKLNLASGEPVPPAFIDAALRAATAAGGDFDPAKVLAEAKSEFTSWAGANGYARNATPPAGQGAHTSGSGSPPPAEGRQGGSADDFESMSQDVVRNRCANEPGFRSRWLKWKEQRMAEQRAGRG